jgi:hypothetical protein
VVKQIKLRWLPGLLLVAALSPAIAYQAGAQGDSTYKVGDIVEFKLSGKWVKGKIDRKCIDGDCGVLKWNEYTDDWMPGWIPTNIKDIRRPGAADQPAPPAPEQTAQRPPQEQPAAAQAQGAVTCPTEPPAKTRPSAMENTFKALIRARYEQKPEGPRSKTTTVTFQSFKLGATHSWRPGQGGESPDGPGGNLGTIVYPVKADYTVCSDYPGYEPSGYRGELQIAENSNTFYCFKDQFGEWKCNLGEGKNGKPKSVPK